jgi:hypothetical protein
VQRLFSVSRGRKAAENDKTNSTVAWMGAGHPSALLEELPPVSSRRIAPGSHLIDALSAPSLRVLNDKHGRAAEGAGLHPPYSSGSLGRQTPAACISLPLRRQRKPELGLEAG